MFADLNSHQIFGLGLLFILVEVIGFAFIFVILWIVELVFFFLQAFKITFQALLAIFLFKLKIHELF